MPADRRDEGDLPRAKRVEASVWQRQWEMYWIGFILFGCVAFAFLMLFAWVQVSSVPPLNDNQRQVADHAEGATRRQIESWYGEPKTRLVNHLGEVVSIVYEKMGPNGVYTYSYTFNFIDGRCVGVVY